MKANLVGLTFGSLTVTAKAPTRGKQSWWMVRCICGREREMSGGLRARTSPKCRCERQPTPTFAPIKHGMTKHPGYWSWRSLKQRCNNPNDAAFEHYGGRGIAVCERWLTFPPFWEDMGATWFLHASIERQDVNGHYEPSNCVWIPRPEQAKNRRNNVILETPWGPMTIADAARRLGMSDTAFGNRIRKGWRGDRLFQPPQRMGRRRRPDAPRLPNAPS